MHEVVAGGTATITLLDDALSRLTCGPDTEVSAADARDVLEQSLALVNGTPYAIPVDMSPILHLSMEARALFGSEDRALAAAMLGHAPMDRVIAASVMQSVHDVRFLTDEVSALDWLTGYLPIGTDQHRRESHEVSPIRPG